MSASLSQLSPEKLHPVARFRTVLISAIALLGLVVSSTPMASAPRASAIGAPITVTFDANPNQHQGGATLGSVPASIAVASGESVTLPSPGTLARAGFTFAGWTLLPDGSGTVYLAGTDTGSFTPTEDTTLYAKWSIPEAARLFGLGGEQKVSTVLADGTTNRTGNIRGVTNDGTYLYYVADTAEGNIIRKVTFSGVSQPDITVTGTDTTLVTTVIDGVRSGKRDFAYSQGHIFVRADGSAGSALYAISAATGVLTQVTLPTGKSFFEGQAWLQGNLIDFPDGRIGAVSKNKQDLTGLKWKDNTDMVCPVGFQCKVLRLYTISISDSGVTATHSEDILLADDDARASADAALCWRSGSYTVAGGSYDGWPCDDHGIATDGTYLYQSHHSRGYKAWGLQSGIPSYVVFNGDETTVNGTTACGATTGISGGLCAITGPYSAGTPAGFTVLNPTYFSRDHTSSRYIMGDFAGSAFLLTAARKPPAGIGDAEKPNPPSGVITSAGDGQVTITPQAPTGGPAISRYVVTASPGGQTCTVTPPEESCTISGLTNGTSYTFSVVAENKGTESDPTTSAAVSPSLPGGEDPQEDEQEQQSPPPSGGNENSTPRGGNQQNTDPAANTQSPTLPPSGARALPQRNSVPTPQAPPPAPLTTPVVPVGNPSTSQGGNRSFIGGREVPSTPGSNNDRDVSLRSGGMEVGLQLNNPNSSGRAVTNPATGQRELLLSPSETISFASRGFMPGSTVQVWSLGGDKSPELGRTTVGSDGVARMDFRFSSGIPGVTVPVGPRVIQVTGVDPSGKPVVMELLVRVDQGAPEPQLNRETEQLPSLRPGQSLGTSGGQPIPLTFTGLPDQSSILISAGDFAFQVGVMRGGGQEMVPGTTPSLVLSQGGQGVMSAEGLLPGTTVSLWFFSTPAMLQTAVVGEDGTVEAEFVVDQRLIAPGEHTLQIQGIGTDGLIKAANLGVTVTSPEASWLSSPAVLLLVAGAVILLAVIASLVLLRRRRDADAPYLGA